MTHIELDDQILNHPKFIRAIDAGGSDVWLLWCGLRAYCSQLLTDGFIPDDMFLEVRGPRDLKKRKAALQVLKDKNLVEDAPGGVILHDYLDWADSREEILIWRQKARDRKRKERLGSRVESRVESQRDRHSDSACPSRSDSVPVTTGVTDTSRARKGEGVVVVVDHDLQGSPEGATFAPRPPPANHVARCERSFEQGDPAAIALFQAYKQASGKTGATYDGKRREFYERLVYEQVTPEMVRLVVAGAKTDHFAREENKLDDKLILGTASQREKYIARSKEPPKPKPTAELGQTRPELRLSTADKSEAMRIR